MIKAIILDLSGVLFSDGLKIGSDKICRKYGFDQDQIIKLLDGDFASKYRQGAIIPRDYWLKFQNELNLTSKQIEDIKTIWLKSYQINQQVVSFIKDLKEKFRVLFLSDQSQDQSEYLNQKYHFTCLFDGGVFSFQARCRKPSKQILEYIISKYTLNPVKSLYLDDRLSNLEVAKDLGFNTLVFETLAKAKTNFRKLKLL